MPRSMYFEKDDGRRLPVGDEYLLPFLTPTTVGSHYREQAPSGEVKDRQYGRMLLQVHQLLHLFREFGVELKEKALLDIGTGSGVVPRFLLEMSGLARAAGADPNLTGEDLTSWHAHDADKTLLEMRELIQKVGTSPLQWEAYEHLLEHEDSTLRPMPISLPSISSKPFCRHNVSAHQLSKLGRKFDLFYSAWAMEHISDWKEVFKNIRSVAEGNAVVYFKHRSFFSYLGPHRYSTLDSPWGHLLLTESEYKRFARERHPGIADEMIDFYYNGLTYPRVTVSGMIQLAADLGFLPIAVIVEPSRHLLKTQSFIGGIDGFWEMIGENFPSVGAEEMFSGIYHILFRSV